MTNNKTYVGSSVDLPTHQRWVGRFLEYLNPKHLARELIRGDSIIYKALLKHGYSVFGFKILVLVEVDFSPALFFQLIFISVLRTPIEVGFYRRSKPYFNGRSSQISK